MAYNWKNVDMKRWDPQEELWNECLFRLNYVVAPEAEVSELLRQSSRRFAVLAPCLVRTSHS